MERVGGEDTGLSTSIRKVVVASFIGTTIEWYDFFIYTTAAALIFPQLFFPSFEPLAGTLASFATYAVGFLARPLGGVIFGHYGDKIGRKAMLVTTLLIMGIATFLVGLLPTYETIGIWAPILLVVLRLLQGLGLGGEWGGAVLMAVEHSPDDKRGLNGSWPQMGVPAGLVLGTGAFAAVSAISGDAFVTWGWRVPFLLSILLIALGLYIRLAIYESPAFSRVRESGTEARMPIVDVFRTYPKNVLLVVGSRIGIDVVFYIFAVYMLTYVTTNLGLPRNLGLIAVSIAALIEIFTIPAFASLSDKVGRRPVLMAGAAFLGLWIFPFFWLLDTGSASLIILAVIVGLSIGHAMVYGTQASFYAELFGTRVRYSGASLGYQLAGIFGGALAPIVATALYAATGGPGLIGVYVAVLCLLSIVCVYLADETFQRDIYEDEPQERQLIAEQG
ncbi:MAG: MHS family MFS transporter [Actinomycetota bacterium]|nr:MHS family MFS transporter [Actinomycetota bacterium]